MKGPVTAPWGKLARDSDGKVIIGADGEAADWHPLPAHCADVAACLEVLLHCTIVRRRLARLGGLEDLDPRQVDRLCALSALHDMGKYNHGFQNKAPGRSGSTAGHVHEALAFFNSSHPLVQRLLSALNFFSIEAWCGGDPEAACSLLVAIIAHHGRPESVGGVLLEALWLPRGGVDPLDNLAQLTALTRTWFPGTWEPGGRPLPTSPAFQHGFCGLVTLADWLGSDTRFFPFGEVDGRMDLARESSLRMVRDMGLDSAPARSVIVSRGVSFDLVLPPNRSPRPPQQLLLDIAHHPEGSITVLEASTGAGKTEAAVARFLRLHAAGAVDGMYFALPTRTAATQIHQRLVSAMRQAFPDEGTRPPVVLAVPGYLLVDDCEGTHLPGFEVRWDDDDRRRFRSRGWAAENPKRFMAGTVLVGTVDQVLLSTLAVGHSHMRAAGLLRHLLVIDEVHASDSYMIRILEAVLSRQLAAGGHALLMSATLGAAARQRLLHPGEQPDIPPLDEAATLPFPLICHRRVGCSTTELCCPEPEAPRVIEVELEGLMDDPDAVARLAIQAAVQGARVLVIRNTVTGCMAVQQGLETAAASTGSSDLLFTCREVPAPHHSRFSRQDRGALDMALEQRFGHSRTGGPCVAVATQTVQQSLDLDADYMITDLCPMDVLLQRIGRLHRHDRSDRAPGFGRARLTLLTPDQRILTGLIGHDGTARGPHGLGTVYEDLRALEATWRELAEEPRLEIPTQCRRRVERALHPDALDHIATELGAPWPQHAVSLLGTDLAKRLHAKRNLADWSVPLGMPEALFLDRQLDGRILTRLGQGDRRVRFEPPLQAGPFGLRLAELTLPAYLAPAAPDDALPEAVEASAGTVSFAFGGRRFIYDRLGLRPAPRDTTLTPSEETNA